MVFFRDVKLDRSRSLLFFVPQENANITVKLARLLPNNMSKPARYGLPSKKEPLLQIPKNRQHLMGGGIYIPYTKQFCSNRAQIFNVWNILLALVQVGDIGQQIRALNSLHTLLPGKTRRITYFSSPFVWQKNQQMHGMTPNADSNAKCLEQGTKTRGPGQRNFLEALPVHD